MRVVLSLVTQHALSLSFSTFSLSRHLCPPSLTHARRIESQFSHLVVFKGAPERVLGFCSRIRSGDSVVPLDQSAISAVEQAGVDLAKQGHRVMGFAHGHRRLART